MLRRTFLVAIFVPTFARAHSFRHGNIAIGQYAHVWHLGTRQKGSLTDTVKNWKEYWPAIIALPHPSPRNNMWLRRNPWFDEEILPVLRSRVTRLLN